MSPRATSRTCRGRGLLRAVTLGALAVWSAGCGMSVSGTSGAPTGSTGPVGQARIVVTSPDFRDGGHLPVRFTCDGAGDRPTLHISGVPTDATDIAVIIDDPDAPHGVFTHWVLVGVPADTRDIAGAASPPGTQLPNSGGTRSYVPPCPPSGTHHYRFTVYALGEATHLATADLSTAVSAVRSDAVASGRLVATYQRAPH